MSLHNGYFFKNFLKSIAHSQHHVELSTLFAMWLGSLKYCFVQWRYTMTIFEWIQWVTQNLISWKQDCITKCEAASHRQCSHTLPPSLKIQSHAIMLLFIQYDIRLFLASIALNASGIKYSMTAPCAVLNKYRVKASVFTDNGLRQKGITLGFVSAPLNLGCIVT